MPSFTSVLILGAGGELGSSVLQAILQLPLVKDRSVTVTAALRPKSSSTSSHDLQLEAKGCKIQRLDVSRLEVDDLAAIFSIYDVVISCLGFAAGPGTQLRITRAALEAKVRRFFPWQFGVDYDAIGSGSGQDLFDEQLKVRELLRSQAGEAGVDWIIVSTGVFMSFVFEEAFGIVEGFKTGSSGEEVIVRALGAWEYGLTVTAVEDIGRLTAAILADESVKREVVYVSGDTFTYQQLANTVQSKLGTQREIDRQLWTREYLEDDLKKFPDDTMRKYRVAFAANRGVSWPKEQTYNVRRGITVKNLTAWMKENIAT